ncbi:unannotated protein [freshwater metagenome]|uniref:Unannotated protein n=1 Tax=freshwater metagenome TaxID=449393 RepID=A0A6J6ITI0_9ZZZZ
MGATESLQGGETPDHVQIERTEPAEFIEPVLRECAGAAPDHSQKGYEHGPGEQQDEGSPRIEDGDEGEDRDRNHPGKCDGGEERRDIPVKRIDPAADHRTDLTDPFVTDGCGARSNDTVD